MSYYATLEMRAALFIYTSTLSEILLIVMAAKLTWDAVQLSYFLVVADTLRKTTMYKYKPAKSAPHPR